MRFNNRELHQIKTHRSGTHRARSIAQTLAWLQPALRHVGITRLANITGLDTIGIPVWTAIRPNSRGLSTSQGKGLTHDAAKASALMESVESWHAENTSCATLVADYDSLRARTAVVDPFSLNSYADASLRADLPIVWVEAFDLVSQQPCHVPYECVSTNYVVDGGLAHRPVFVQSSNGLAGGNHLLEAMCHALAEVIERHAVAQDAQKIRAFAPELRVKIESIGDEECRELIARFERARAHVAVFELSSSFGIPAFAATVVDADETGTHRTLPPFNGYGCHLNPAVALNRALTEAAQSRATYISGSRDDISASEYERSGNRDDLRAYKELLTGSGATRVFDQSLQACETFEEDLATMIAALRSAGYGSVLVVDLSNPSVDIPVVKVIVPGLHAAQTLIHGRPIRTPKLAAGSVVA